MPTRSATNPAADLALRQMGRTGAKGGGAGGEGGAEGDGGEQRLRSRLGRPTISGGWGTPNQWTTPTRNADRENLRRRVAPCGG